MGARDWLELSDPADRQGAVHDLLFPLAAVLPGTPDAFPPAGGLYSWADEQVQHVLSGCAQPGLITVLNRLRCAAVEAVSELPGRSEPRQPGDVAAKYRHTGDQYYSPVPALDIVQCWNRIAAELHDRRGARYGHGLSPRQLAG